MADMDQVNYGWDSIEGLGRHTGLVGGLLIVAGAVISLAMAVTKVRRLNLWMIATVLYVAGVFLVAMPHQKH